MTLIRESAELNRRERDKIEYLTPGSAVNYSLLSTGVIAGDSIKVINGGTATVTVLSSNASTITSLLPGTDATFVALVSSPTTAANFKAVLTAMDPTALSDAAATRAGLKSYSHGTTYNGGIAPTVILSSGAGSLSTVDFSEFIPYQMQNGSWRLKFNLSVTLSTTARTEVGIAINGVTYPSGYAQLTQGWANRIALTYGRSKAQSTTFFLEHASDTTASYYFGGDVALASKPTWAY